MVELEPSKRRIMSSVVYSILQKRISALICSAYQALSSEAAVLLADTPPMDLPTEERAELYRRVKEERKRLRPKLKTVGNRDW